jgi:predicted PurR-regulated permease PerM
MLSFILASFTKYSALLLQNKYKTPYKYGVISIFLFIIMIFIINVILLFPLLIKESYGFFELISTILKNIESGLIFTGLPLDNFQLSKFTNFIPNLGQITVNVLAIVGEIFTYTLLIFVLAFYIAIQDTGLVAIVKLFAPNEIKDKIPDIIVKLQYHIGKWAFIEVSIALIMGIFIYTILTILEFQYASILSIMAGIFQLIPILGPIIIYIIIILIAFIQSPILAVITILLIISIQLIKRFLILPIMFKSLNTINPLLVVFALIIGGVLAGTLGVLISMPVVSLANILYRDIINYDK